MNYRHDLNRYKWPIIIPPFPLPPLPPSFQLFFYPFHYFLIFLHFSLLFHLLHSLRLFLLVKIKGDLCTNELAQACFLCQFLNNNLTKMKTFSKL